MRQVHVHTPESTDHADGQPPRPRHLAPLLFAASIWFIATFFLLGDLGRWLDDYATHHLDARTGEADWSRVLRPPFPSPWRVLHMWSLYSGQTIFWNHSWVLHLVLALLHAACAWRLWALLRTLLLGRRAAAAGAIVFLAAPFGYEAIFWHATIGTLWGTLLFLVVAQHAARAVIVRPSPRRLLIIAPLAALIPLWYEQPVAALAALITLAVLPAPDSAGLPRRVLRAAVASAAAGLPAAGVLMYTVLTRSAGSRGAAGTFSAPGELWGKISLTARQAWQHFTLDLFAPGALTHGLEVFASHPVRAAISLGAAAVSAAAFLHWWCARADDRPSAHTPAPAAARSLPAALFGITAFLTAWLPIIAVRDQWTASRLCYLPTAAAAVFVAALIHALLAALHARRWGRRWSIAVRAVLGLLLILAAAIGATMLVGVQDAFARRARLDARQAARLLHLVPDPPPGAFFAPVAVADTPTRTGSFRFDHLAGSVWNLSWSCNEFIKLTFRSPTVFGAPAWAGHGLDLARIDPDGLVLPPVHWIANTVPRRPPLGHVIGFDSLIPFEVDQQGRLTLFGRLRIESDDNRDRVIDLPIVHRPDRPAFAHRRRVFTLTTAAARQAALPVGLAPVPADAWRRPAGAPPAPVRLWGVTRSALAMHAHGPSARGLDRAELVLPPSASPRRLHLRVTMPEWAIHEGRSDGAAVTVSIQGQAAAARLDLDPARLRRQKRWFPLSADLPPSVEPLLVELSVVPGRGTASGGPGWPGSPDYDHVYITTGFVETLPP